MGMDCLVRRSGQGKRNDFHASRCRTWTLSRSRESTNTADTAQGAAFPGPEDWIFRAVGSDLDVLLIGPDAIRFAGRLSDRRCRVTMAGCESAPAVTRDLDELDLALPRLAIDIST